MNKNNMLPTRQTGFSLLELMVALVIVAIFAAIAIPSYQSYARRSIAAQAQQSMKQIAVELEKHKSRNFNYLNFVTTPNPVVIPAGATGAAIKYEIVVRDGDNTANALTSSASSGQNWAIRATSTDEKNNSYVMTSTGVHCYEQGTAIGFDCSGAESW